MQVIIHTVGVSLLVKPTRYTSYKGNSLLFTPCTLVHTYTYVSPSPWISLLRKYMYSTYIHTLYLLSRKTGVALDLGFLDKMKNRLCGFSSSSSNASLSDGKSVSNILFSFLFLSSYVDVHIYIYNNTMQHNSSAQYVVYLPPHSQYHSQPDHLFKSH